MRKLLNWLNRHPLSAKVVILPRNENDTIELRSGVDFRG